MTGADRQWQLNRRNFEGRWCGESRWYLRRDDGAGALDLTAPGRVIAETCYAIRFFDEDSGEWDGSGLLFAPGGRRRLPLSRGTYNRGGQCWQFEGAGGQSSLRVDPGEPRWGHEINLFHGRSRSMLVLLWGRRDAPGSAVGSHGADAGGVDGGPGVENRSGDPEGRPDGSSGDGPDGGGGPDRPERPGSGAGSAGMPSGDASGGGASGDQRWRLDAVGAVAFRCSLGERPDPPRPAPTDARTLLEAVRGWPGRLETLVPGDRPAEHPWAQSCEPFAPEAFAAHPLTAAFADGLVCSVPEWLPAGPFRLEVGCRTAPDAFQQLSLHIDANGELSRWERRLFRAPA